MTSSALKFSSWSFIMVCPLRSLDTPLLSPAAALRVFSSSFFSSSSAAVPTVPTTAPGGGNGGCMSLAPKGRIRGSHWRVANPVPPGKPGGDRGSYIAAAASATGDGGEVSGRELWRILKAPLLGRAPDHSCTSDELCRLSPYPSPMIMKIDSRNYAPKSSRIFTSHLLSSVITYRLFQRRI